MIKLVCMDLDGVLVVPNNFWMELHKAYGTLDEGTELTKQYLTTDYARLVDEVVGRLWKGKDAAPYFELAASVPYMKGIKEYFAALDKLKGTNGERLPRAIITGGCYEIGERVAKDFGVEFIFANQLMTKDGKTTGEFQWPVGVGGYTKQQIIEQLCDDFEILPQNVLYIGDSDSDIEAFRTVGVSIAFNCVSRELRKVATHVVESNDLRDLIPILQTLETQSAGTPKL
jgi:phosphoserine phosphatase